MNRAQITLAALLTLCAVLLFRAGSPVASQEKPETPEPAAQAQAQTTEDTTSASPAAPTPGALEIIHQRKSVRTYTDEAIPRETLETIVRAGMAAPTGGNRQPWTFFVVTQRETLDKLAEGFGHGKMLKQAQAAIVVAGVPGWGMDGVANDYWVQDTSAATQNILLAVEALGLGAVWIGAYPREERVEFVRSVLDIAESIVPLNVLALGHPTGVEEPKDKFKPERIHWERFEPAKFEKR